MLYYVLDIYWEELEYCYSLNCYIACSIIFLIYMEQHLDIDRLGEDCLGYYKHSRLCRLGEGCLGYYKHSRLCILGEDCLGYYKHSRLRSMVCLESIGKWSMKQN